MKSLKLATAAVVGLLLFSSEEPANAHRSGCHRWHSCPSDTGSYVCGDLGYSNYCPRKRTVTTPRPTTPPPSQPASPTPSLVGKNGVTLAQNLLAMLGYSPGPADGMMGPRTRTAIKRFQLENGLKPDGQLSRDLLVRMSQAAKTER